MMQFALVVFLLWSTKAAAINQVNIPSDANLVICRIICTVFLHITLNGELQNSLDVMKYSLN